MTEFSEAEGDGEERAGSGPQRLCVVTREPCDPEALIRFVRAPDGLLVCDPAARLPGRGVWVTCSRSHVATASRSGAFARSLKGAVKVPDDLAAVVEALLQKRALAALALANKAGLAVAGFGKAEAQVSSGSTAVLLHASDAARDGVEKLDRRLRTAAGTASPASFVVRDFTNADLSLALGRSNVVHAALRRGGASRNFIKEAERLRRYRADGQAGQGEVAPAGNEREDADFKEDLGSRAERA